MVQRDFIFIFLIHHWEFKQRVSDTLPFVESGFFVSTLFSFFIFLKHFSHSVERIAHLDKSLCCDIHSPDLQTCLFQSNSLGEFIELASLFPSLSRVN